LKLIAIAELLSIGSLYTAEKKGTDKENIADIAYLSGQKFQSEKF
jgi:hypothetical protein